MITSKTLRVFPSVKSSGYQLKVFVFKLKLSHNCQMTIGEKHLRQCSVRMNSMSKSQLWQTTVPNQWHNFILKLTINGMILIMKH